MAKENIVASIESAKANLQRALEDLDQIPAFDHTAFRFAVHALNNYLTVTNGLTDLIAHTLSDYPHEEVHIWLGALFHATDLMTQTIRQMSNSGVETDVTLQYEMVDVPTAVNRVCKYYQSIADRKKIHIHFEASVPSPTYISTNRVASGAILDNLLSNAIKYSPPGKQIWVKVTAEAGNFVCSIRDEGPGLSEEDQAKLFQRGVRLTPIPTAGEESSGYGLAVAQNLAEKLKGKIWCESQLGQGSCFYFQLPMATEESAKLNQGPHASFQSTKADTSNRRT